MLQQYAKHALCSNHEVVFTHGDLTPWNIFVNESGKVTAILDWGYAGWYPEYWDILRPSRI